MSNANTSSVITPTTPATAEVSTIQRTRNYNLFTIPEGVSISEQLIETFLRFFDAIATVSVPIIVDRSGVILENHHLFVATMRKELPVRYTVYEKVKEVVKPEPVAEATRTLFPVEQIPQQELTPTGRRKKEILWDKVNLHATRNVKGYNDLQTFEELYKLGEYASCIICTGNKLSIAQIKEGVPFKTNLNAIRIAEFILKAGKNKSSLKSRDFAIATTQLFEVMNPSQEEKLLKNLGKIQVCANVLDYKTQFQSIINFKSSSNRIELL